MENEGNGSQIQRLRVVSFRPAGTTVTIKRPSMLLVGIWQALVLSFLQLRASPKNQSQNAWFLAYADERHPKIALVVLMIRGSSSRI